MVKVALPKKKKKTGFPSPAPAVQGDGDSLGGPAQDQRVVLVLGGHVAVHQHVAAVAARRAQRRRILRVPGRARLQWTEGADLHQPRQRESVRAAG